MKWHYPLMIGALISGNVLAKELTLAGSTTFQKSIIEPCFELIKSKTGIEVKVLGVGTGNGVQQLADGKVEAAIASSEIAGVLKKHNLSGDYKELIVKQDIIVPIVHKDNKVSELTWEQIADLNTGKAKNWKDVGGEDLPVAVVTSHKEAATRAVLQELVMKKAEYAPGAREVQSTRLEVDMVGKMKGAIGAVSESFAAGQSGIKVVKTTPISRPLSIITKGAPSADVQKIFDLLKTPEAQKLFK